MIHAHLLLQRDQRGITLIQFILSIAISSILTMILGTVLSAISKIQTETLALAQIEIMSQSIQQSLINSTAWERTISRGLSSGTNPAQMNCLRDTAIPCLSGKGVITNQPFALFDGGDLLVFDARPRNNGFDGRGTPCNGFIPPPANGNNKCPFRFELTWTAVCNPASCTNPQVKVNARLIYNPDKTKGGVLTIDTRRFSLVDHYINPRQCSSGYQVFAMPGSLDIPVPNFKRILVVELWGGGGGGAGVGAPGFDGGRSSFNGEVIAGGGKAGTENSRVPPPPANPLLPVTPLPPIIFGKVAEGGRSSGGDSGSEDGKKADQSKGGDAPQPATVTSLPPNPCIKSAKGGAGGKDFLFPPAKFGPYPLGAPGSPGKSFGGGGYGAAGTVGLWNLNVGWLVLSQGGGGGAYAIKTYYPGQLKKKKVTIEVGKGGAGGVGASYIGHNGPFLGGHGGDGGVVMRWE